MSKKARSCNFSSYERDLLVEIVKMHPVIEDKRKQTNIEAQKASTWNDIVEKFNSDEQVNKRNLQQLKVLFLYFNYNYHYH